MDLEAVTPRLRFHAWAATAVTAIAGLLFVWFTPAVGDMWAALARAQAVHEGVGLGYWFSWYAGAHPPGGYSVMVPTLSALLGAHAVVALAATALPWAVALTVTQVRRPIVAVWVTAVSAILTLGAGRTAFLVGAVIAIGALDAAIRDRRWLATILVILSGLASPVAVAFVLVGLGAGFLVKRHSVIPIIAGVAFMVAASLIWGSSGPEGYGWARALISLALLVVFLIADPARPVKFAIGITAAAVMAFSAVPNAMGSNLARLVFAVLPVAVAATARRSNRMTALAVVPALAWSAFFTAHDLEDAHASASSVTVYRPLVEKLHSQPDIDSSRVEVVADGTHTAAYVLAKDFWLARGYETQADRALNDGFVDREAVMTAGQLNAWLRDASVRYVALNRHPVKRTGEWIAASARPEGWHEVWSNADWVLFRVDGVAPLVTSPASVVEMTPSRLRVAVPASGTTTVRVRWSRFLTASIEGQDGGADVRLVRRGDGWTDVLLSGAKQPVTIVLTGRI